MGREAMQGVQGLGGIRSGVRQPIHCYQICSDEGLHFAAFFVICVFLCY